MIGVLISRGNLDTEGVLETKIGIKLSQTKELQKPGEKLCTEPSLALRKYSPTDIIILEF